MSLDFDRAHLTERANSGANWFYWLAALSLGNSIWAFFSVGVQFFFGLGISMVADALATEAGSGWRLVAMGFGMFVSAAFAVLGIFARRSPALFMVGIALYALDAALLLVIQAWIHAAVHGYVLFRLIQGWQALRALRAMPPDVVPAPVAVPQDA